MDAPLPIAQRSFRFGRRVLVAPSIAAIALFVALPGTMAAQTRGDSVAVGAFVDAYRTTWDEHDPAALGTFFTQDADMIMGVAPAARGRAAIQRWWHEYFARQEPERRLVIEIRVERFVAPGVAVVDVATTTGGRSAEDEDLRARRARGTWVVVRKNGAWHIAAMRGMPTEQDQIIRRSGGRN